MTGIFENLSFLHFEKTVFALRSHVISRWFSFAWVIVHFDFKQALLPSNLANGGLLVLLFAGLLRSGVCEGEERLYHFFSSVSYQIHFISARTEKNTPCRLRAEQTEWKIGAAIFNHCALCCYSNCIHKTYISMMPYKKLHQRIISRAYSRQFCLEKHLSVLQDETFANSVVGCKWDCAVVIFGSLVLYHSWVDYDAAWVPPMPCCTYVSQPDYWMPHLWMPWDIALCRRVALRLPEREGLIKCQFQISILKQWTMHCPAKSHRLSGYSSQKPSTALHPNKA